MEEDTTRTASVWQSSSDDTPSHQRWPIGVQGHTRSDSALPPQTTALVSHARVPCASGANGIAVLTPADTIAPVTDTVVRVGGDGGTTTLFNMDNNGATHTVATSTPAEPFSRRQEHLERALPRSVAIEMRSQKKPPRRPTAIQADNENSTMTPPPVSPSSTPTPTEPNSATIGRTCTAADKVSTPTNANHESAATSVAVHGVSTSERQSRRPLVTLVSHSHGGSGGGQNGGGESESSGGDGVDVVLTDERLNAVRCYLRDEDPLFVRTNLRRLLNGTLVQLENGDSVSVARRCRGGENNEGGPGTVARVLPNFFYDVKYAVSGVEKGVDACFVEKISLGTKKPRGSTPRCPDCHSFLHECTCMGFMGIAATAASEASMTRADRRTQPRASWRGSQSRSLKRPRAAMGKGVEVKDAPPHKDGRRLENVEGEVGVILPNKRAPRESLSRQLAEDMKVDDGTASQCAGAMENMLGHHDFQGVANYATVLTEAPTGDGGGKGGGGGGVQRGGGRGSDAGGAGDTRRNNGLDGEEFECPAATTGTHGGSEALAKSSSADSSLTRASLHEVALPRSLEDVGNRSDDRPEIMSQTAVDRRRTDERLMPAGDDEKRGAGLRVDCSRYADNEGAFALPGAEYDSPSDEKDQADLESHDNSEAPPLPFGGVQERDNGSCHYDNVDQGSGEDNEVPWTQRGDSSSTVHSGGNTIGKRDGESHIQTPFGNGSRDNQSSSVPAGSTASAANRNGDHVQRAPSDDGDQAALEWRPRKGDLVEVERRMTPGVNKPGGTARVVKVDATTGAIDVRYVVEGGWERGIDPVYVREAVLDISEVKRPTLGRCRHCGSLRIDCRQGCEYYLAPPPRPPPPPLLLGLHAGSPFRSGRADAGETRKSSGGKKTGQQQRSRRRRRSVDGVAVDEGSRDERRRRRRLPIDWDEDGVSMPGSEGEENESKRESEWEREESDGRISSFGVRSRSRRNNSRRLERDESDQSEMTPLDQGCLGSSSGTSDNDDGDTSDSSPRGEQRGRQRRYGITDSGSESGVELLGVQGDSRRAREFHRDNEARALGSDSSSGDGEQDSPRDGSRSRRRKVGAGDPGEWVGGEARFLMPEGEEASRSLPSDIVDPTRGVKDPVILRQELQSLLQRMEGCDAEEFERDIPAVCRRVGKAAATSTANGTSDLALKADVMELPTRIKRALRRLDVANNIYVRLEKLEARWREGVDGENAWHRLDRLSVCLEEWRRDADRAVRDYRASVAGSSDDDDDDLSPPSDQCSATDLVNDPSGTFTTSSSEDFDMRASSRNPRNSSLTSGAALRRQRGTSGARRSKSAAGGAPRGQRKRERGGTSSSVDIIGYNVAVDSSGGSGGSSIEDLREDHGDADGRGKKRPRRVSSSGKTRRRAVTTHPQTDDPLRGAGRSSRYGSYKDRPSGGSGGGDAGRRGGALRDWIMEDGEEKEQYLPGFDYGMVANSDGDEGKDGRRRSKSASSSISSSAESSPSSSSSRSLSPVGGAAGGRSSWNGAPRSFFGPGKYHRGSRNRGDSAGGGAGASRRGTGSARNRKERARATGGGRVPSSGHRRNRSPRFPASERHAARDFVPRQQRSRRAVSSIEAALYRQRVAEQEARGGPQHFSGGVRNRGATGRRAGSTGPNAELTAEPLEVDDHGRQIGAEVGAEGRGPVRHSRMPSLVDDLLLKPQFQRILRFKTLYSKTLGATEAHLDDMVLKANDNDIMMVEIPAGLFEHDGGGNTDTDRAEGGMEEDDEDERACGELDRALNLLPQRMSDLEELAREGLDNEAEALSVQCCKVMAVIGAKLRALANASCSSGGTLPTHRRPSSRTMTILRAANRHVKRLAAAAAPGGGENQYGIDSVDLGGGGSVHGTAGRFAGLSLAGAVTVRENCLGSRGANALVGTCAALHVHLLEWLQVTNTDLDARRGCEAHGLREGGGGDDACDSSRMYPGRLLDFTRRLLLDLLFLFEKQLAARRQAQAAGRRGVGREEQENRGSPVMLSVPKDIVMDPLAELWCASMDALDSTTGATMSSTLHPPASINIPGLKRPLVGFWGVFFEIVSGGLFPASSSSTEGGGGSKGDGGSQNCSWKGGLPSELVWKALIYAVRLRFLREGWDGDFAATFSGMGRSDGGSGSSKDEGLCSGNSVREDLELAGGGPTASSNTETAVAAAEVEAANAAHRTRRKETSKALWQCVRLLLAASPFAIEFAGDDPGEASAVTATAKASAAALGRAALATSSRPGVIKVANSGHHFYGSTAAAPQASSLPLLRVAEEAFQCSTSFGMVARVLLERVLVLARVYPPEAGPRGVVEKLWEGVQRVSVSYTTLLCTGVDARGAVSASSGGVPSELVATSEGRRGGQGGRAQAGGGGQAPSKVELLRPDEKEGKRIRSARRLGRKQPALTSEGLSRLLASAVKAWCLPVHTMCHLPRGALEGSGVFGERGRRFLRAGEGGQGEGDYEALCSLVSLLTQEHAMRLPEGLKRRRLANGLLKAKYSSPGSSEGGANDENDDVHALAPSRVLLGIALGLARAGLGAAAAKELVKAAAVRPRNVSLDTPRDRSIALIAPAATSLCLALPHPGAGFSSGTSLGGGSSVRATLFGVLAECMRDAVNLLERVLDEAGRLGQAINPQRLERPRAVVGVAASCILVALHHLGPLAQPLRPLLTPPDKDSSIASGFGGVLGTNGDGKENRSWSSLRVAPLDLSPSGTVGAAAAAAGAFVEVLGRALDRRFVEHLGRPTLTIVLSALVQCWPSSFAACGGCSRGNTTAHGIDVSQTSPCPELVITAHAHEHAAAAVPRDAHNVATERHGYAMGWWRRRFNFDADGTVVRTGDREQPVSNAASSEAAPELRALALERGGMSLAEGAREIHLTDDVRGGGQTGSGAERRHRQQRQGEGEGKEGQEEDGEEQRDEYGSWDGFSDDAELNALLSGCTATQASSLGETQREQEEHSSQLLSAEIAAAEARAAAVGVEMAKVDEETEEVWRTLAGGAQAHVLPHLPEILRKAWTIARYAQGPSTATIMAAGVAPAAAERPPHSRRAASSGSASVAAATGSSSLSPASRNSVLPLPTSANVPSVTESEIDASAVLKLHASAALVVLRGNINGGSGGGGGNQQGKANSHGYASVREKYLDLHNMAQNNLLAPQQRLLAPAFFCLALSLACTDCSDGPGYDLSSRQHITSEKRGDHPERSTGPREDREDVTQRDGIDGRRSRPMGPGVLLVETLRGREWEVLHVWMQAALDPMAFPALRRGDKGRTSRNRGSRGGRNYRAAAAGGTAVEPSDIVREGFETFTRCLSRAFGWDGRLECDDKGGGGGGGGRARNQRGLLDTDVSGVFEKRLMRFEPAQLAALSTNEAKILERILDIQSVIAHCGALWTAARVIGGPAPLSDRDKTRLRDRVVKLVHTAVKSLKRFLPEVFPRGYQSTRSTAANGSQNGKGLVHDRASTTAVVTPPSLYGSTFRRLYGHAAYALVACLTRMCGSALKGPPLKDLVETCFEGIACHGFTASAAAGGGESLRKGEGRARGGKRSGGGDGETNGAGEAGGASQGRGEPHPELTALAVMHTPDLLQCFSEMPMTVPPVTGWIKNINDHVLNASPSPPPTSPASGAVGAAPPAPLICSLAAGLRGDLRYPSPPAPPSITTNPSVRSTGEAAEKHGLFVEFVCAAALAPPPRPASTVLAKRHMLARMRLEVLGDGKLRLARFLMEASTAGAAGRQPRAGVDQAGVRRGGLAQSVSVRKTCCLLVLLTEVFRRRRSRESHEVDDSSSSAHWLPPPLDVKRDILALIRPAYSLLGGAFLGEPGPIRRLGRQAMAAATALSTAALDASAFSSPPVSVTSTTAADVAAAAASAVSTWVPTVERRVAECFAEAVVLAVSTKLDTFLIAMETSNGAGEVGIGSVDGGCGGGGGSGGCTNSMAQELTLGDLAPREVELEHLLRELGAWEMTHGAMDAVAARGWPHNEAQPFSPLSISTTGMPVGQEKEEQEEDTPLPVLFAGANDILEAFRSGTAPGVPGGGENGPNGRWWRRIEGVLLARVEACRLLLPR